MMANYTCSTVRGQVVIKADTMSPIQDIMDIVQAQHGVKAIDVIKEERILSKDEDEDDEEEDEEDEGDDDEDEEDDEDEDEDEEWDDEDDEEEEEDEDEEKEDEKPDEKNILQSLLVPHEA